jgi:signal recognition particle subunit SRP54
LGKQIDVAVLPIVAGESAVQITRRALQSAKLQGFDVLILDTAGRITLDEGLMNEVAEVAEIAKPVETLLVADSLTGQDAVRTAAAFHARLPLTGLVLTRADGDGRGGAMLSMRAVTGLPIKYLGAGEKVDALDVFDARRVAGRILGQGDIVALVEKASQDLDQAKAEKMARKLAKGQFDLDDLAGQLQQMKRMGGLQGIMGMLPGVAKMKGQMADSGVDDRMILRQEAIISSMTKVERKKPDLLNASRKKRIAAGAGVDVQDVNRVLKQHRQMADVVKQMARGGPKKMQQMAAMLGGLGGGGGIPGMPGMGGGPDLNRLKALGGGKTPEPSADDLKAIQDRLAGLGNPLGGGGQLPGGLPGLPGFPPKK